MRFTVVCLATLAVALLAEFGLSEDRKQPPPRDPYADNIAQTEPRSPAEEQKAFHLPPGFEMQLVASEPDIHKPINMNFDAQGRLWVTTSVEYPFPAGESGKGRDCVKILEDFQEDGRAGKISTFVDGLNIPIGVLPLTQGGMVYSIPNIYRVADTDGDGLADRRDVLYGTYGFKDTHGMTGEFTWNFDGWVYACHGFSNTSTVKGADGQAITMNSGNTYRMRPDGSHLEYNTHGQVNPFGLTLDPLGNLYSCDCHSQPIYQLLRGAYYPSFGKPDDGLGYGPETFNNYKDSTAIAGIAYYAADHFPPEYRDVALVGDVVTNRIVRFRLEWHGSSSKGVMDYFLKSDDPWFRPVDIKVGPDGALYVLDFYNRIIGHYEVPLTHPGRDRERGRIWRIVYRGPDGKGKPAAPRRDWTTATIPELIQDLAHPNLTVRLLATHQLVSRGPNVDELVHDVMHPGSSPWQRAHGLWVLERRGSLDEPTLTAGAHDAEVVVRVHAQRVLANRGELSPAQHDLVLAGLKDSNPFVQRCAADALGRHPSPANVRPLLDLRHAVPGEDTHLLHVVRMALRDQLLAPAAWSQLPTTSWSEADARAVADVAPGVPSAEAAAFLLQHVEKVNEDRDRLVRYVHHIARHGSPDTEPRLLAFLRGHRPEDLDEQVALLRAVGQGLQERGGSLSKEARGWSLTLARRLLTSKNNGQIQAGIDLTGTMKLEPAQDLLVLVTAGKAPEAQRVAALNTLANIDGNSHLYLFAAVVEDSGEPLAVREQAANLLARSNQAEAQEDLLRVLPTAPARLQNTIALALAGSPAGAEKLLEAITTGKASARLLQEKPVEQRLLASKVANVQERVAKLTEGLPAADQRLQDLLNQRRQAFAAAHPDPALGAQVFEKNCAICHQLGGKGARIGPQLDGIGVRGVERLMEDILDPSRNVDQAFRQTTLELKNGQVVYGLVLREEGEVLVLADVQGKEVRVPRNTVEERTVTHLSPMPANFADQIPEPEFYNLLAFLLTQQGQR